MQQMPAEANPLLVLGSQTPQVAQMVVHQASRQASAWCHLKQVLSHELKYAGIWLKIRSRQAIKDSKDFYSKRDKSYHRR